MVTYRTDRGHVDEVVVYREQEGDLRVGAAGRAWGLDGSRPCSGWWPRPAGSGWPTCSIPAWRCT
jgi:hypothetical protein